MSTRGMLGVVIDGEVKATYNHFDSYPSGLGVDVVKSLTSVTKSQARALSMVKDENGEDKVYWDHRDIMGDLAAYLERGTMPEGGVSFAYDSLFCEWGYLVDFDSNTLEVYRGFNESGTAEGRFSDGEISDHGYGPITLVGTYPLDEVTVDDMDTLEERIHEDA